MTQQPGRTPSCMLELSTLPSNGAAGCCCNCIILLGSPEQLIQARPPPPCCAVCIECTCGAVRLTLACPEGGRKFDSSLPARRSEPRPVRGAIHIVFSRKDETVEHAIFQELLQQAIGPQVGLW